MRDDAGSGGVATSRWWPRLCSTVKCPYAVGAKMILASQRSSGVFLWPTSWPRLMQKPPTEPVISTIASRPCQGKSWRATNQALKMKAAHSTGTSAQVMRR